jgi:hypothetical protein
LGAGLLDEKVEYRSVAHAQDSAALELVRGARSLGVALAPVMHYVGDTSACRLAYYVGSAVTIHRDSDVCSLI